MTTQNVDNVNMKEDDDAEDPAFDRPYHHGNLRTALIEAGLRALEQTDASELSLRAIAREVGVSANAAYRHFADKPALLRALASEGFRRFDAAQKAAHTSGAMASGQAYIAFACAHPALFRLMFGNLFSQNKDPELMAASMAAFQGLLQSSAQDIEADPSDERALVTAIARWSMVHGLSHLMLDGQLAMFGDRVDQLVHSIMSMHKSVDLTLQDPKPSKVKPKPSVRR